MNIRSRLDPIEEHVDEVVHALHCRYPLLATLRIVRQAIVTATLGILTRLHPSTTKRFKTIRRHRIVFPDV